VLVCAGLAVVLLFAGAGVLFPDPLSSEQSALGSRVRNHDQESTALGVELDAVQGTPWELGGDDSEPESDRSDNVNGALTRTAQPDSVRL
jgi:hypothetical protein